jgi:hypothetical protein
MLESQTLARPMSTTRSRITNGKSLLANIDGRTADARRYRDLAASLADDLGGVAGLTEAQRALVRQAAAMIVQSEKLQGAVLRGELVDVEQLTRLANAATRILSRLGIRREQRRSVSPLAAHFAQPARQREHDAGRGGQRGPRCAAGGHGQTRAHSETLARSRPSQALCSVW